MIGIYRRKIQSFICVSDEKEEKLIRIAFALCQFLIEEVGKRDENRWPRYSSRGKVEGFQTKRDAY